MGRPTTYKPEYCQRIIELATDGRTIEEWAADIGVWPGRIHEWAEANEDFQNAKKIAQALCAAWWIRQARENLVSRGNPAVLIFCLKNIAKWTDRPDSEIYGQNGKPVKAKTLSWLDVAMEGCQNVITLHPQTTPPPPAAATS